jgi:serine protease AprX
MRLSIDIGPDGTPHIITNSWGYFQRNWDEDYNTNTDHRFTRVVIEAIDEGIIVLFAEGNGGGNPCSDGRCEADTGTRKRIWGPNRHKRVISVRAVNKNEEYVGYSSCWLAALDPNKPDFASVTHFTGFFDRDSETSAATAIAAGVSALLKEASPGLPHNRAKEALMLIGNDKGQSAWDISLGAGIIQPKAA